MKTFVYRSGKTNLSKVQKGPVLESVTEEDLLKRLELEAKEGQTGLASKVDEQLHELTLLASGSKKVKSSGREATTAEPPKKHEGLDELVKQALRHANARGNKRKPPKSHMRYGMEAR